MKNFFLSQYNEGFYTQDELKQIGFKTIGENVLISRLARIYGASNISIGNYVRIDDFVILSGKIDIGNFVHIGAFASITGGKIGVKIGDFCGMSSQSKIFATSDDYSGKSMTNPCIPIEYKKIIDKEVILEKHSIIGSSSILLPNAYLAEGVALGAMSLINKRTLPWGIYFGIPAKRIKERKKDILQLEQKLLMSLSKGGGVI